MGFISCSEDIQDRKDNCSEGQTTVNQLPTSPPIVNSLSLDELNSRLSCIAREKEVKVKELRQLETELNRLNGGQDPHSRFIRSLLTDRQGPLPKSGKERGTVRRQRRKLRERIKKLEELEQRLLAKQKKLSG